MKTITTYLTLAVCLIIVSCNKLTDFSPYDANISKRNLNEENILRIQNEVQKTDSITFIAISDTHANYSDLKAAVSKINELGGTDFVVVCGDLTNYGLSKEFQDYYDYISRLNEPFVTLIGNHDYLSNGKLIYTKMFGPTNFTFDIGKYRFVLFDDIVWENNNSEPDFSWLSSSFVQKDSSTNIVLMHIPLWANELGPDYGNKLKSILEENSVSYTISGHEHNFKTVDLSGHSYLVLPEIAKRSFAKITLIKNIATLEMINF